MSNNFNARFPPKPVNKRSVFERQRAEAEAKRQRDNAETAAVYEDFVKSFDDAGDTVDAAPSVFQPHQPRQNQQIPQKSGITIGSVGGRRHFSIPSSGTGTPPQRHSGPGSLGYISSTDRRARELQARPRRAFDDSDDSDEDDLVRDKAAAGRTDRAGRADRTDRGDKSDRAEEKAVAKPTVRLANLPPGTSPASIKALVANNSALVVDGVQIQPPAVSTATTTDRKALAAIVTLAAETPASEIDAAVSALQNRYLGFGYYLTLHRHLSSAVVSSSSTAMTGMASSSMAAHTHAHPFGAKPVPPAPQTDASLNANAAAPAGFAPPPSYYANYNAGAPRGYAGRGIPPPPSLHPTFNTPSAPSGASGILHVQVRPPSDIKKLRMIHKVIEQVLEHGPAFEALLMSRPAVQRDEKWAWLWDARGEAGVWYRFRLWQTVSGLRPTRGQGKYMPVFEGSHAWKVPDRPLPYEFDTSLAELVSDSEYDSSDDSDADNDREAPFLNPLEKARLVHLLARLPASMTRLRKGDVARITAFAMTHANRGADEVVDTIVANVERPFSTRRANNNEAADASGAQLVAVYIVSDILASSATSGMRHAWRFRQLFEAALRRRNVFEGLGLLASRLGWGRLRADKWRRSIMLVLSQWDGWSVFSAGTQAHLVDSFEGALKQADAHKDAKDADAAKDAGESAPKKSRWKTVAVEAAAAADADDAARVEAAARAHEGYDSEYTDDEALDAACMDDEDIDGEPMDVGGARDAYVNGTPLTADEIRALVGSDVAEMSEEGEIGSDDDDEDYYMSLSEAEVEVEVEAVAETEVDDAPVIEPVGIKPVDSTKSVQPSESEPAESIKPTGPTKLAEPAEPGRIVAPRKRMRAADMFADSE